MPDPQNPDPRPQDPQNPDWPPDPQAPDGRPLPPPPRRPRLRSHRADEPHADPTSPEPQGHDRPPEDHPHDPADPKDPGGIGTPGSPHSPYTPYDDPREAIAPTGAGGAMDLAMSEAETLDKRETEPTTTDGAAPGPGGRPLQPVDRRLAPAAPQPRLPRLRTAHRLPGAHRDLAADPHQHRPPALRPRQVPAGRRAGPPFGFDTQGCDVYARTVHGARASITVGITATLGAALLGSLLGGLAGFFGGWSDALLSRTADIFFGIPVVLGGLVFLSVVTSTTVWPVVGFIVLLGWPQLARIARGSVITSKQHDYVQAARSLGASPARILLRHVAPNAVAPVIVVATIALGTYIALEATLSFLGVGLRPPTVSWGIDISNAAPQIRNAPHMLLWPAGRPQHHRARVHHARRRRPRRPRPEAEVSRPCCSKSATCTWSSTPATASPRP